MLAGVADGLTVCDWLGDRLGLGEVLVGADVGAVEEGLVAFWVEPAGATVGTGRTRMYSASTARNSPEITRVEVRGRPLMRHPRSPGRCRGRPRR